MTIYWEPDDSIDPVTIDVWHVAADGTQTEIGPVDVSDVSGMPDSLGGVVPDAVKRAVADATRNHMNLGNSPVMDQLAGRIMLDMLALNYERGTPP